MHFIRPSPAHPHLKRSVSFLWPSPPYQVRVHPSSRANPTAAAMAASPPQLQQLTITRPDDWHLHLREGDVLAAVLPYSARHFWRAIVMPNLKLPVTTTAHEVEYREEILKKTIEEALGDRVRSACA